MIVKKSYYGAFKTHKISFEYSEAEIDGIEALERELLGSKRDQKIDKKESLIALAVLYVANQNKAG